VECTEKPEFRQLAIDATRPGEMRFFLELVQELLAEEIFYDLGIEIRHVMKPPLAIEEALAHDPMNMGILLQKVSCSMDGKDGATRRARCAAFMVTTP